MIGQFIFWLRMLAEGTQKVRDLESMARAGPDIAISLLTEGDYYKAIDIASRVNKLIEKTQMQGETFGGPSVVYSALMVTCGYCKGMLGDFVGAHADCDRAIKNAITYGNTVVEGISEYYSGMVFLNRGDWKTARVKLQRSMKLCEKTSFYQWLALAWGGMGLAEAELSHPENGIKFVEKGLKVHQDANIDWLISSHFFSLGICNFYSGDLARAIEQMEEAYRLAESNQEKHNAGKSLIWLGRLTGLEDSPNINKAIDHIQRGLKILNDLETSPDVAISHLFLGELYWNLSNTDKASSHLKTASEMFEEMGMNNWLDKARAILDK